MIPPRQKLEVAAADGGMERALPLCKEHAGPGRRSRAGGEPWQVPLDRHAQLLLVAMRALCEGDRTAGSKREQPTVDRVSAGDTLVVERELRGPEGQQGGTAKQLQLASITRPARSDTAP